MPLDNIFAAGAQVPNLYDIYQNNQLMNMRQQEANVQTGQLQMQQQQLQAKQAQQQAYNTAIANYQANPTPAGMAQLIEQFPDMAQGLSKASDVVETAQRKQAFSQMAGAYAQSFTDPTGLANNLTQRMQAEIAAGTFDPNSADPSIIKLLQDGVANNDKASLGKAQALILANAYAHASDPSGFLDVAKTYLPGEKPAADKLVNYNGILLDLSDPANPKTVAQVPGRTMVTVNGDVVPIPEVPGLPMAGPNGIVPYGGGGSAAPAPRVSPQTLTKLGVLSNRTGLRPDQQFGQADIPKIVDAMTAMQGAPGFADSAWARAQPGYAGAQNGMAQFKDPASARQAAVQLLTKRFSGGQNTLRALTTGVGGTPEGTVRMLKGEPYVKSGGEWHKVQQ